MASSSAFSSPLPSAADRNTHADLIGRLAAIVGADAVLEDLEHRRFYSLDFSEEPGEIALAVVKPSTAEQVADIVLAANMAGVAVNTRGGAMSYTRGHVPVRPDTLIVDATGLNRIIEINTQDRYVTLETGVTWAALRAGLRGTGFRTPYIGTLSGNHATVGGGLSQNATGMGRVTLAEHVLGLEVVLGDGRIMRTGSWATRGTPPIYRYNGPDLTGMFLCDSGAFGIKTKVHLLLEPTPKVSFGCVAFGNRIDLVRGQAALAQTGLQTEAFAFDGHFVSEYAKHPPPDKQEKRRMVGEFLADHPNKLRAWRNLLRAWHPKGLGFLDGLTNIMYYSAEAHDQAAADRMERQIERLMQAHGGKRVPTTIPFGLRYGPFLNVGEIMANREGEVNFPINAKFAASRAVPAMEAFEAFLLENRAVLQRHGIRVACNSLLHGHFWGIEPVIFWKRPLGPYRMHYATEDRRARSAGIAEDAERTAAAIDFRHRLTRMFREMGSFHVQWAKAYPYADALAGQTAWDMLTQVKAITDPNHTLNPGVLGLGLQRGRSI
ncbi:FAD-binding oxidoreductase [Bordetella sp. BOR01]|uniref:FAD-binding oxidoreductase n=1 Tax=Bordetella sp. BOR01 TaxID=2854779 RepID=UPI001C46F599|nr:FAD-binding oxidoreductase [Bordetella sp. BOR01]MBV7482950.1 FAD-binding oxidoreductase [Bordetella sp. BOR01]